LRKPPDVPGEPLDSGCGLYWVSPVIPMKGSEAMYDENGSRTKSSMELIPASQRASRRLILVEISDMRSAPVVKNLKPRPELRRGRAAVPDSHPT
ncbi:MAG: hypothetical protein IIC82_05410, partial [Chloroflexi bacterium]|nr:hypothetical protein [Chloroflexota bacterium]